MRQLPNDINAEAAVLSAMMLDQMAIIKAVEKLEWSDFYKTQHQHIYRAMTNLFENNVDVDTVTVISQLKKDDLLNEVGGELFLNELSDVVLRANNVDSHIKIILEKSNLRKLIKTSQKAIDRAYDNSANSGELICEAQKNILAISDTKDKPYYTASESCHRAMNLFDYRLSEEYEKERLVCGIDELDDILCPFNLNRVKKVNTAKIVTEAKARLNKL